MRVTAFTYLLLMMLSAASLSAQDIPYYRTETTKPVEQEYEEPSVPKVTVGLKSGANISFTRVTNANTGNSVSGVDNESKPGMNVSAVVFIPFNERAGIAIEPGYLLKQNAYSFQGPIDTVVTNNSELHYFSTSLTYRKYFGAGLENLTRVRTYLAVGANFNFLVTGIYHQSLSSSPLSVSLDLTSDYSSFNLDLLLAFGTEVQLAPRVHLLLEARGGLGLTDFDDSAYSAASNSTASNSLDFIASHLAVNMGLIVDF